MNIHFEYPIEYPIPKIAFFIANLPYFFDIKKGGCTPPIIDTVLTLF